MNFDTADGYIASSTEFAEITDNIRFSANNIALGPIEKTIENLARISEIAAIWVSEWDIRERKFI
ncbi:MAG: hypothetical protein O9301_06675 [Leptospira sp.]|nr:hypothetical protein [Leptospira sp.]